MLTIHDLVDRNTLQNSIITIGNYDGVHLGHRFILDSMCDYSKRSIIPTVLVTFRPHTNNVIFNSDNNLLTPENMKIKKLQLSNLDFVCYVDFDLRMSKMNVDDFMLILIEKYNPTAFYIGYDNKFGYKRQGTYKYLKNNAGYKNISIIETKQFKTNQGNLVKTSLIKKYIINGDIKNANNCLGYKYGLLGKIIKGQGIGKKIGFPTGNVELKHNKQLIPSNGVYSVNLETNNIKYKGICNIGVKPTISSNKNLPIEVHLLDIDEINLYNKNVCIEFKFKIRQEICFKDIEELRKQIKKDIKSLKENNE